MLRALILTLQFLPIDARLTFLKKIGDQLPDNGLLIIVEKTRCAQPQFQKTI